MSQTPLTYSVTLPPASEEQATRQAQARGQRSEEYLSALVIDTLARRAAEEAPAAGPDPLAFWEQAMERHRAEPPGTHPGASADPPETGG